MESTRTPTPSEALDLVAGTRADLADRLVTPWWYHPALGLLVGTLVASFALDSILVLCVALGLYGGGVGALMDAYRRRTGVWVSGHRRGRAGRWAAGIGVATAVAMVGSVALSSGAGWTAAPVVAGILVVPVVVVLGRRFDAELRAELRGAR